MLKKYLERNHVLILSFFRINHMSRLSLLYDAFLEDLIIAQLLNVK